jgi:long-chain acyl-CoA synthetase
MSEPQTLHDLLDRLAEQGNHPALVSFVGEHQECSYGELHDRVGRLARGLAENGIAAGTTVGLFAPNGPQWVLASLALIWAGAVPVPLDVRLGKKQLAHCLKDSDCRFAFATADTVRALRDHHPAGDELRVISLDAERPDDEAGGDLQHWWRDLLAEAPAGPARISPDDTAVLFYTSGTTGAPKGVPLSHGNIVHNIEGLLAEKIVEGRERALLPLPLHHVYPFTVGMLVPLAVGAAIVFPAGISGSEIAAALKDGRVTVVIGVPRLYQALLQAINRRVGNEGVMARAFQGLLASARGVRRRTGWRPGRLVFRPLHRQLAPDLHLMVAGGSKLDPDLADTLQGLGWDVLTGYGLTETSPIVSFNSHDHKNLASVGRPLRGLDVKIVPLEEKEGGEITVKGPSVFAGYRNLDRKTRDAFTGDGYFRTGDIGHLDDDGFLFITARVKETIVLPAGENIYPEDVEDAFLESDLVAEAAVLEHEERLALLVVPDPKGLRGRGAEDNEQAIEAEVKRISDGLPSYQRIAHIFVTKESLPRTTLGKLRRHELPALVERAQKGEEAPEAETELSAADESLLQEPRARRTWEWLQERFPDRKITPNASLFTDIGIDSLDWVDLSLELEREIGVRFDEAMIKEIETVRDLLEAAGEAEEGDAGEAEPRELSAEQQRWIEQKGAATTAGATALSGLNKGLLRVLGRLKVEGLENLPEEGPFVLAPNHTSYLDPPAIMAALPPGLRRQTYWAGHDEVMFSSGPRRLISRLFNVFPIDPLQARSALAFGDAVLERGGVLILFPEGRRSKDGQLQRFEPGIGQLAEHRPVPLVPVHIEGTHEAWPVGRRLPRPHPIRVRFGRPLDPAQVAAEDIEDRRRKIAEALHDAVAALGNA